MTRYHWGDCSDIYEMWNGAGIAPVIVGGQAVNLWAEYFRGKLRYFGSVASKDLDAAGNQQEAQKCASAVPGAEFQRIKATKPVPMNSVVLVPRGEGEQLRIDFIDGSDPVSRSELEKLAVPIPTSGPDVRVMHPRHCVMSRTYNVVDIMVKGKLKYDNPIGLRQLQTSMQVFRLFMRELLANSPDGHRRVQKNYEALFHFLRKGQGKRLWETKKIDLFSCIEPLAGLSANFLEKRYPQMHELVSERHPCPRAPL